MEEMYNNLMANPWIGVGVPIIIFVISVVLLFRRFFSFVFTIVLFVVAVGSAFTALDQPAVQEYFGKDIIPGKSFFERLTDSFQCLKSTFWFGEQQQEEKKE